MPNLYEPEWEADRDEPPFRWRRARLAAQAGASDLGASLFEVPAGAATFPLHAHYNNEELVLFLAGRPTLTPLAGARELAPGEVGVVRLGFISTAAYNVLPRVLPAFRRARPGIRLTLVESTTDAQLTALRDDALDAGLVVPPVPAPLRFEVLLREPLIAALPGTGVSTSTRRRWPRRLPLETLADEPFILFPRRAAPGLYDLVVGLCAKAGFVPRIEQEAIQMPTIVSLVGAGIGVALVPASLAQARRTDVVYRPLAEPGPPMEVGLAWNEATPTPAVAAFIAHVRGVFTPGKR
jgi:DNA-binding transcriptional LysR family regulator